MTIIIFLIVLSILVLVHELGHFLTARFFKVKAEEFGFGFPPRFFAVYKNKEGQWKKKFGSKDIEDASDTIYSINYIPLGGFVRIKGENGDEKEDKDSFATLAVWKRFIILAAGVFMNIVLAMIVFSIVLMSGAPQELDNINPKVKIEDRRVQIMSVSKNSPADKAGVFMGDIVFSINGKDISSKDELQKITNENVNKETDFIFLRGKDSVSKKITPEFNKEINRGIIGVDIAETGIVKYPWYMAIFEGVKYTFVFLWMIIVGFFNLIVSLFKGVNVSDQLSGPVGIANLTGQMAKIGFVYLLQFLAILSLNLAVINFLPLPALDGGRIIFLLIEKIKGSPVKKEVEGLIHNIGFSLLILLMIIITFKDVSQFSGQIINFWHSIIK